MGKKPTLKEAYMQKMQVSQVISLCPPYKSAAFAK
jgi:hypothetical protein